MKKQTPIHISGLEKSLLKDHVKSPSSFMLVRLKAQAVLLAAKDMGTEDISDLLDRTDYTITEWLRDWRQRRLSSIFTGHAGNTNASKLSPEQLDEIGHTLEQPPSDAGLPKEFWDVPQLKQYIKTTFDVVYESKQSYHFLLKFSNLSFKYADVFDRRRNEQLITARMKEIRAEIAPALKDAAWDVFSADEVRIDQEAITRRAWLKKGEKTIIKVNRKKESQSYLGFLSQKSHQCHLYEMDWQNSDEVLKVIKQLLDEHPNKKLCIVWDNAAFHRSKKIKEALGKGNLLERVRLIWMPPYAPDENPIEKVWGTTKQAIANIQHDSFEYTKHAFSDYVASRQFKYSF